MKEMKLIIMDNGGSYKSKEIGKYIEKTGNKLQYSVLGETRLRCYPYRPRTNAIENYFNQLKHYFGYEIENLTYPLEPYWTYMSIFVITLFKLKFM